MRISRCRQDPRLKGFCWSRDSTTGPSGVTLAVQKLWCIRTSGRNWSTVNCWRIAPCSCSVRRCFSVLLLLSVLCVIWSKITHNIKVQAWHKVDLIKLDCQIQVVCTRPWISRTLVSVSLLMISINSLPVICIAFFLCPFICLYFVLINYCSTSSYYSYHEKSVI